MPCRSHQTGYWEAIAKTLEHGKFDWFFFTDGWVVGTTDIAIRVSPVMECDRALNDRRSLINDPWTAPGAYYDVGQFKQCQEKHVTTKAPITKAAEAIRISEALASTLSETYQACDARGAFPAAEITKLKDSGLLSISVPRKYGGPGLSYETLYECVMNLATGNPSVAQMAFVHWVVVSTLLELATESQCRECFEDVIKNGSYLGQAASEKNSKNVVTWDTTFTPDGEMGGARINGTKFFTTGSLAADIFWVVGMQGNKIAMGMVPKETEGITIHDDWNVMGQRGTASGSITFTDAHVKPQWILPEIKADGLGPASLAGPVYQIGFSALHVGIAKGALKHAVDYIQTKTRPWVDSGTEKASQDPYILHHVGHMSAYLSAAEGLVKNAARLFDNAWDGRHQATTEEIGPMRSAVGVAAAEAKLVSTEVALRVCQEIFQLCGARSALATEGLDRFWRDARTLTLHDPVDYKAKLLGDFVLNGTHPPISLYS